MSSLRNCFIIFVLISTRCSMLDSQPYEDEFPKGISTFAQNFYQQCSESKSGDNMIISTFSTLMALALLCQATEGTSFEELRKAMHLSGNKAAIMDQFHKYYGLVQKSAGESEFMIGNQIFVMKGYQLQADFQEIAVNKFSSGVESVNFTNSLETAQKINQFVKEKTKEKIKEIVKPNMFDNRDRVFFVNVIYLKSKWLHPFLKNTNRRGSKLELDFFINETNSVRVEFMTVKEKFWYATLDDLNATAVRLDYVNSSLSFVIILPRSRIGLSTLESQLNNYDMSRITNQMKFLKGDVTIPKFKVQSDFSLGEILQKMGIVSVFDYRVANLSGLINSEEQLHVEKFLHNVIIEINEEHTEAAASTGWKATSKSRKFGQEETFTFLAEHPFRFYIWDRDSKTTIFSGRITNFPTNSTL